MKKKSGPKATSQKRRSLFKPTEIVTLIRSALCCDLEGISRMHDTDYHPTSRLALEQMTKIDRKYVDPGNDQTPLETLTFAKFHEVNEHMASYKESFEAPMAVRVLKSTPIHESVLLKARAYMHMVLDDFCEEEFFDQCRNGPGTSIGVSYNDTSLEAKFTLPISITERVVPLMDRYLQHNFQLAAAVKEFNSENPVSDWYTIVKGSRATTVDKNNQIRRMIAIEPTANMYFQQGLMALMYKRMRKFGLDVETLQSQHRLRARNSSITSKEATIDWSSASDCVLRELLKWLLPPKWFMLCDLVRSPSMNIGDQEVSLNMFSTMGNAVTFPLETLVFWTIGHAVLDLHRGNRSILPDLRRKDGRWVKDWLEISVFGDDCIVPSEIAESFIQACTQFGFIINSEKSFYRDTDHGFRESCGGDYLHGYDVRPFYLKAPSTTSKSSLEPWLNIMFNRLLKKYIMCFGSLTYVYDKELWRVMEKLYSDHGLKAKLVPEYFPDDAGLKITCDIERFAQCYPKMKLSKITRSRHGTYSFLYLRFIYREKAEKDDYIRYVNWLNRPARIEVVVPHRSLKKKGGYVVAKGISSQWTVPRIKD